jgi:sugar/nucleoside kinase (ribokinase family)
MFDIITFGSATIDIFLKPKKKDFFIEKTKKFISEKQISLPLDLKVDVEDLKIFSGGGGTNTASTFSNFGFKTAYCGKIGKGTGEEMILNDLKRFKINTSLIIPEKKKSPALSLILTIGSSRTIFVSRGACHFIKKREIPFKFLKAKWFYLAPLSGESAFVFKPLVDFAFKNKIKVFANLGNSQINLDKKILYPSLSLVDILLLNVEESLLLSRLSFYNEDKVLKKLRELTKGIIVITKGKEGSIVLDGKKKYSASVIHKDVVEKTGAGDAFGAGFLTGFIKTGSLEYAIKLGTNNASSCISKIGAKEGLLKKGDILKKVKIWKS